MVAVGCSRPSLVVRIGHNQDSQKNLFCSTCALQSAPYKDSRRRTIFSTLKQNKKTYSTIRRSLSRPFPHLRRDEIVPATISTTTTPSPAEGAAPPRPRGRRPRRRAVPPHGAPESAPLFTPDGESRRSPSAARRRPAKSSSAASCSAAASEDGDGGRGRRRRRRR